MAKLIQKTPEGDVEHELLFGRTSIGRGWLNDVVTAERTGPRRLAEVVALGEGKYAVRDLGAPGGVTVNGERVSGQRLLADGDVIRLGQWEFVLDAAQPAPAEEMEAEPPLKRGLFGGVLQLVFGTLFARAFGWARDVVAMAYFGASGAFDAYVAAITLPNLFRDVLGEHAAEGAFMPAHKTLRVHGREAEARRLTASVLSFVVLTGSVLAVLCALLAPQLMAAIVPGFAAKRPELWTTATSLARWMMPFLVIIAVGAVFGSLLIADRRFWRYALAPAGASACVIAAIVLLTGRLGVWSLAVGVVAGGLVQMAICAMPYVLPGRGLRSRRRPLIDTSQPAFRKVVRSVVPIALSGLLNKLIWVVDRALASWFCDLGRISALYVAHRLLQLPHGVVGLAVGRAAFPSLIEQASSRETDGFSRAVVRAVRLNVFLTVPAMVGMIVLGTPLVRVLYQRRAFTSEHTQWVALALVCYAAGLVGMGVRTVLSRAFYSLLNTRTPFVLSAVAVGTNVVLSVGLVVTPLGHGGLALASSLATWLQVVLLGAMLHREVGRRGRSLSLRGLAPALGRMALAAGLMAAATWGWLHSLAHVRVALGIVPLAVPGLIGLGVYLGAAYLLRCDEMIDLLGRLRRRRAA